MAAPPLLPYEVACTRVKKFAANAHEEQSILDALALFSVLDVKLLVFRPKAGDLLALIGQSHQIMAGDRREVEGAVLDCCSPVRGP